jgi:acetyltransferase
VTRDRNSDGLLVIRTPQVSAEPAQVADVVARYANLPGQPILASWMGGAAAEQGAGTLSHANIPTFPYPDTAARIFTAMWRYSENLRSLYETPILPPQLAAPDQAVVSEILHAASAEGRTLLTEAESKRLLAAYGIPVVATRSADSMEEAVAQAAAIGYPVVVKLASTTITHKTDVGGVQLNLVDASAVRRAYQTIESAVGPADFRGVTIQPLVRDGYELIVGSTTDPQFGPVILFGAGGQLVEVLNDQVLGLPPLTTTLARQMIVRTQISRALAGIRGRPASDLLALERLLVRFSQLVLEQPRLREIEINPLHIAYTQHDGRPTLLALDARIVLHASDVLAEQLPKPPIRPYPSQYVSTWTLKDGTAVTIRPIRPEDEPLLVQFHQTLSDRSVYMRYFSPLTLSARTAHERLIRMCFIDYDREMALVVDRADPVTGAHAIVAVGRMIKLYGKQDAEYAGLVSDQFQGHGLGTEVLRQLLRVARDEGVRRIVAETLPENRGMQRVFEKLGFRLRRLFREGIVLADIEL